MAESFEAFMRRRQQAALAYTRGDSGPVDALLAQGGKVTFFGPDGGRLEGREAVLKSFDAGAAQFEPQGDSRLEILQMASDGEVGFWSGIQHATARIRGRPEPVGMQLRITELFRREDGEWRLTHRHADMLKPR